jgi:hypothetical protein
MIHFFHPTRHVHRVCAQFIAFPLRTRSQDHPYGPENEEEEQCQRNPEDNPIESQIHDALRAARRRRRGKKSSTLPSTMRMA